MLWENRALRANSDVFFVIICGQQLIVLKEENKMAYTIAADKCVACGCCKDACPAEAISEGTPYSIDADKCLDCGACAGTCPSEAITQA